jgi:hypothetical protein
MKGPKTNESKRFGKNKDQKKVWEKKFARKEIKMTSLTTVKKEGNE